MLTQKDFIDSKINTIVELRQEDLEGTYSTLIHYLQKLDNNRWEWFTDSRTLNGEEDYFDTIQEGLSDGEAYKIYLQECDEQ